MSNLTMSQHEIRDSFTQDFLGAYARTLIAFARLEFIVKLAIKDLTISMKLSPDFAAGIAAAESRRLFGSMCDYMLELHQKKYGASDEGKELGRWVERGKKLAEVRGKILHGFLTVDDDGRPVVRHTRLRGKNVYFTELSLSGVALERTHTEIDKLWVGLDARRRMWVLEAED